MFAAEVHHEGAEHRTAKDRTSVAEQMMLPYIRAEQNVV